MTSHGDAATAAQLCEVCGRPDCNWFNRWHPTPGRAYLVSTDEGPRLEIAEEPEEEEPPPPPTRRARRLREDRAKRPGENTAHQPSEDR